MGTFIKFVIEAVIVLFVLIPLGVVGLVLLCADLSWRISNRHRQNPRSSGVEVHRWTEREPNRLRTFEKTTQSGAGGGVTVEVSYTHELATSRQIGFLQKLGFQGEGLDKGEATLLLDRILRPVNYALSQTFKNITEVIAKEDLRALQVALARSEFYRRLPRYGPHETLAELEASGDDPRRRLTREERMAVTDVAFQVLPPLVFGCLESNGVKKYKLQLEERGSPGDLPPVRPSEQSDEERGAGDIIASMKLETEKSKRFGKVTEELLRKVFADDELRGEFAILSKDSQVYIQTSGNVDGPYCLEYREGDDEHHFQAGDHFHKDDVLRAFLWYLAGDTRWRTEFSWRKL